MKTFDLSRADGGPDSTFSMEPNEFKDMTKKLDLTVKALEKIYLQDLSQKNKVIQIVNQFIL